MSSFIRPLVETLEDRLCLSASSSMLNVMVQGHAIKITGNDEWNFVQVVQDDTNDTIKVVYGQLPHNATLANLVVNTKTFKSSSITSITVDLGNGNDNFEYTLAQDSDLVYSKNLSVSTGDGDDSVTINTAGYASESAIGTIVMPTINAASGIMTADGEFISIPALQDGGIASVHSPVINSAFNVTLDTGLGNDSVCVSLGAVRTGLKIGLTVDLGDGQDQFWLCNYGTISKNATVTINVTGNTGKDAINVGSYGDVLGTLSLNAKGGTEDDTIYVELAGLQNGKTTLAIDTGAGDDFVTVNDLTSPLSTGSLLVSPIR